jgi:tetratricopeptide (TPR) repeat protein
LELYNPETKNMLPTFSSKPLRGSFRWFLLICLFVLSHSATTAQSGLGEPPVGIDHLIASLEANRTGTETTNKILVKQIEERGIDFELTAAIEKRLLEIAASDELIDAIRLSLCDKYKTLAEECEEKDRDCRIANFARALEFHPNDAAVLLQRGIEFDESERYEEAIADYDRVIAIDPKKADAFNNRGNSLGALGRYEEAIKDYERAIALDPEAPDYYFNRAAAHFNRGSYEDAVRDYTKYITYSPKAAEVY